MYSIAAAGGDERRLVDVRAFPGARGLSPALSPDWSKVAFWYSGPLRVENVDGSDPHDVASRFSSFAWAPDSRRLVYVDAGIFVVSADGTGSTSLGPGATPAWSPDSSQLAFVDSEGLLSVMRSDGTERRVVYSGAAARDPSWSPEGNRLAFLVGDSLTVINLDGTGLRTLPGAFLGSPFVGSPQWSHDGALIAALPARGSPGLAVVNVETGRERPFRGTDPSWSPVTNDLAATYDGPCTFTGVRLIAVEKGKARRLTLDCHFWGTPNSDRLTGTDLRDVIAGRGGNDTISGYFDVDTLIGGPGNDRLFGGDSGDFLYGGPGNDLLAGGPREQDAYGLGNDFLSGGSGADELKGGPGPDVLRGDPGNDVLRGGSGVDTLTGGTGDDRLYAWGDGGRGRSGDTVDCGPGHDIALVDRNDRVSRNCEVVRRR
jgi:Ca2+-binding RTX toxin-like protein